MRLPELPDDILILLFSSCDIPSIFSLRLTCTTLCATIDLYIHTIAPQVARNSLPSTPCTLNPLLETPPKDGYTIQWLRSLVPAHLTALILDKDKLRRTGYINSGFPYGIPYEHRSAVAFHWRNRISNGWKVLRKFYLVSRDVYRSADTDHEGGGMQKPEERPNVLRRMSSEALKVWQSISCPYQGCDEHGVRQLLKGSVSGPTRRRRSSAISVEHGDSPCDWDDIAEVRRREAIVLKKRLSCLKKLSQQDLIDYTYLWRILFWVFRPYRKPGTEAEKARQDEEDGFLHPTNWQAEISAIQFGHSWLTWCILHVGTAPFWTQWCASSSQAESGQHHIRDLILGMHSARSHHRIEVEREYICRFEYALRLRCLYPGRRERLEAQGLKGRTVNTISFDCLPLGYDLHPLAIGGPEEVPWYELGQWVWMDGKTWLRIGGSQMETIVVTTRRRLLEEGVESRKGLLEGVRYLVYLGSVEAEEVWPRNEWRPQGVVERAF